LNAVVSSDACHQGYNYSTVTVGAGELTEICILGISKKKVDIRVEEDSQMHTTRDPSARSSARYKYLRSRLLRVAAHFLCSLCDIFLFDRKGSK
jgi:hypothetical protein